jgi:hypothetical protein
LSSEKYTDDFNEVKSLGIANSTTATADPALVGRTSHAAAASAHDNEVKVAGGL